MDLWKRGLCRVRCCMLFLHIAHNHLNVNVTNHHTLLHVSADSPWGTPRLFDHGSQWGHDSYFSGRMVAWLPCIWYHNHLTCCSENNSTLSWLTAENPKIRPNACLISVMAEFQHLLNVQKLTENKHFCWYVALSHPITGWYVKSLKILDSEVMPQTWSKHMENCSEKDIKNNLAWPFPFHGNVHHFSQCHGDLCKLE